MKLTSHTLHRGSTLFLKAVIYLMGIGVLAFCALVLIPAIGSDNTGYYRPILIGMIVSSIPFFIALYQALRLLSYIDTNTAFSERSTNTLQNIKYCALTISGFYALGMPYIFYAADRDDAPGVILIGMVIVGASFVVAVFAAVLRRLLESALAIQSENDLTV